MSLSQSSCLRHLSFLIVLSLLGHSITFGTPSSPCPSLVYQEADPQDEDGEADLDKALELNITAKSLRDLDKVAELCESAIEKGLDEGGEKQARQIWVASLLDYADQLSTQILVSGARDRRWRKYRRDALLRLDQLLEMDPEQFEAYLLVARLNSLPGGNEEKAKTAANKAVEMAGDDSSRLSRALYSRAIVSKEKESVLADLDQAIKIDPNNVDAVRFRAAFLLQNDEPKKAIKDFRKFLEFEKDNIQAHYVVIETLRGLGEFDEALELIDKAIKIDPERAASYIVKAQIYLDMNKFDESAQAAGKAIKLDRQNFTAMLLRAQAYLAAEKYDDALEDVDEALELEPQSVGGIHMRAMIYASKEDYKKSISDLETLVNGVPFPANQTYQIQLASIFNANLEPKKAVRMYTKLLRQLPKQSPLRLNVFRGRGDAYLSLAKHKEAVKDYDEALKLDKEDDHTLNNLAWVLSTSNQEDVRDGKRAVELATKACEVTEFKEAHILSTLAAGYAESGDFENALKFIKQGLEISKRDEQKESMTKEMGFYEKKKPFREVQDIEEERAKRDKENGEDSKKTDSKDDKSDDGN